MTTHKNLWASRLTDVQRGQTCGYWFTVTSDHIAHTAFDTIEGLRQWCDERGLKLTSDLSEPGHCRIEGQYRTASHLCMSQEGIDKLAGLRTRTLSNGQYVVAVITNDDDGINTVHTLNPNVRDRKVFDYEESRWLTGGAGTSVAKRKAAQR